MLKIILIVLAVIVVALIVLLIYAATRPDSFRVQRSITIKAPAEKIFPRSTICASSRAGRPGRPRTRP